MAITIEHFQRAIADIAAHGDNDVLPFDIDTKFLKDTSTELAKLGLSLATDFERKSPEDCESTLEGAAMFSERLLAPAGSTGFRVVTKIQPFWNLYLNALCAAVAELHEPRRSSNVHSYRYSADGPSLFRTDFSWRTFKEATVSDCDLGKRDEVVIQTDVSSFYDHIYHHRLKNYLRDLFGAHSKVPTQIVTILGELSQGRSFGLPVGGQGSRVLAEVLMGAIDRRLTDEGIRWKRFVDDFVLIADSKHDAYRSLGVLARALSDFGLSLNRTKTSSLSSRHYAELVENQLGRSDDDARALKEVDLHFDPYSDTPDEDYEGLRATVEQMDIARFLASELQKGQPDSFVVTQVSRAIRVMDPDRALGICATLLDGKNLHAFRANWSAIMRGVAAIRGEARFERVQNDLDRLLDDVPRHSGHLAFVDTNALHLLRALRFAKSERRAQFVSGLHSRSASITIRRACIDCWRSWHDRDRFIALRNSWSSMSPEEQRMMWLAAERFGDDGRHFQHQVANAVRNLWRLGINSRSATTFGDLYVDWVRRASE